MARALKPGEAGDPKRMSNTSTSWPFSTSCQGVTGHSGYCETKECRDGVQRRAASIAGSGSGLWKTRPAPGVGRDQVEFLHDIGAGGFDNATPAKRVQDIGRGEYEVGKGAFVEPGGEGSDGAAMRRRGPIVGQHE